MAKPIRLEPEHNDDSERLPLGFESGENLASGDVYYDADTGDFMTQQQLDRKLAAAGAKAKRVVRAAVKYRLPSDPVESDLRSMIINVPVFGRLTTEELGRVMHGAIRKAYDAIRKRGGKRG